MSLIAVLIACHNRKVKTLACLDRLFSQDLSGHELRVYVVDDGSTDGTSAAVEQAFPGTVILHGDGNLFWCNGMRLAWSAAAESDPDYYLWLNDDTTLHPGAVATMLRTAAGAGAPECIVVGSCSAPQTGVLVYGGLKLTGRHPGRTRLVSPDSELPLSCDTFNGNCVLVNRAAYRVLGIMRSFQHSVGDVDYGLRARKKGIPILLMPGFVGECVLNPLAQTWEDKNRSSMERLRALSSRKGLPTGDWWRFLWTHAGLLAFIYWPFPYLRIFLGLTKLGLTKETQ